MVIEETIDDIFKDYSKDKDIKRLITRLIWAVDKYRFAWQVGIAMAHVDKKLEEIFNERNI